MAAAQPEAPPETERPDELPFEDACPEGDVDVPAAGEPETADPETGETPLPPGVRRKTSKDGKVTFEARWTDDEGKNHSRSFPTAAEAIEQRAAHSSAAPRERPARAARAPRAPKVVRLRVPRPDAPELAQAVSLCLGVLRAAGKYRLGTTDDDPRDPEALYDGELPDGLDLSDEQVDLLNCHLPELALIRFGASGSRRRTLTLAVCPECGRWVGMGGGTAPSTCTMKLGCQGAPVKAAIATKITAETEPSTQSG